MEGGESDHVDKGSEITLGREATTYPEGALEASKPKSKFEPDKYVRFVPQL